MNRLKIDGKEFNLEEKTLIMGILNVTPDSFFDGGMHFTIDDAVNRALYIQRGGADIIDIGGESTRPGSKKITAEEEINRVIPVIEALYDKINIPISLDTYKFQVAKRGIEIGVSMINDITALRGDKKLASLVSEANVPICLMHMKGKPSNMQKNPTYDNIISEIFSFFEDRTKFAVKAGIKEDKIIIDPGIGFGKRTGRGIEDNCTILKNLEKFKKLNYPIMIGASQKRFIGNVIGEDITLSSDERLEGSLAAACAAVLNGANILRVHDVKQTRRCIALIDRIIRS